MSTNKGQLLVSGYHVEGSNRRLYKVYEENNSTDRHNDRITHYANCFTEFTFTQEFLTGKFLYCDVTITNRFTMDKTKFTIAFNETSLYNDDNFVDLSQMHTYSHTNYVSDTDVKYSQVMAEYSDSSHKNTVRLYLSMADFMYGDICVQFYDSISNKDQYCAPVIVQFTNAPTVYVANVYKWRPNFTTTAVEDYDNIFTSSFGSRWQPGKVDVPDTGRTDVLTAGETTDCYNDFMSHDRLITNGYANPNKVGGNEVSLSGHPVYMVEYRSFVPSAFSKEFGINNSPTVVSFSATNAGSGYLTSAVDNWQTMQSEKINLRLYTQETDAFLDTAYQLTAAKSGTNDIGKIGGIKRVFVAHLTATSATRPDDAWFREHTRACADFALSGIDPYWMSNDKV